MELMQGEVQKGLKDERGNPLSKEAAEHMAKHRIRCHNCEKNFCASCNNDPYHLGKLCGQADS
jgi:rRNA maturation endonuclease Nob1